MDLYAQKYVLRDLDKLDNNYIGSLSIKVLKKHFLKGEIELDFIKQGPYYDFMELPSEINTLIHTFNKITVTTTLFINYPMNYPFTLPKIELISIKNNCDFRIDHLFNKLVREHDRNTKEIWDYSIGVNYISEFSEKWSQLLDKL